MKSPVKKKGIYENKLDKETGKTKKVRISKERAETLEKIGKRDIHITRTGYDSKSFKKSNPEHLDNLKDESTGKKLSVTQDKIIQDALNLKQKKRTKQGKDYIGNKDKSKNMI